MKLTIAFVLLALPLCCLAGSGCWLIEHVVSMTIDPELTNDMFQDHLRLYVSGEDTLNALGELKQCFLDQSNQTLANIGTLMESIYKSYWCAKY